MKRISNEAFNKMVKGARENTWRDFNSSRRAEAPARCFGSWVDANGAEGNGDENTKKFIIDAIRCY